MDDNEPLDAETRAKLDELQRRQDAMAMAGRTITCMKCKAVGGHLPKCPYWIPPKVVATMACKVCGKRGGHHPRCPVRKTGAHLIYVDEGHEQRQRELEERARRWSS